MARHALRPKQGLNQELDVYFEQSFSGILENWAINSAWPEIQFLLKGRAGKVLDLACGSGRAFDFLKSLPGLSYFGCDISKPLIDGAVARGISKDRLLVGDATKLVYETQEFEYVFSIGSLEHFTIDGLALTLRECKRVSKAINFHMVPVSKSGFNEGWVSSVQSYWNNSETWWFNKFKAEFETVRVMPSNWSDRRSRGVWFMCESNSE